MTGLEVVALWSSIVIGLISGTLAVMAIMFTRSVDKQNNALNQSFTETLISINEKSSYTQRQINDMVSRVVEAFLAVKSTDLQPPLLEPTGEADADAESIPGFRELRQEVANLARVTDEIRFRQRAQTPDLLNFGGNWGRSFSIGDEVRIVDNVDDPGLRGKAGTIVGEGSEGFYPIRVEQSDTPYYWISHTRLERFTGK